MRRDFYHSVKRLDSLKGHEDIRAKDLKSLLQELRKPSHFRYFFYDLNNTSFLSFPAFQSFLSKELSDKESIRQHSAFGYLKSAAREKSVEVYRVIRESKPVDSMVSRNLLDIVLQLEAKHAAKLVYFVTRHLVSSGASEGEALGNLIVKYLESDHKNEAGILFEHLSKPIVRELPRSVTKKLVSLGHDEAEGRLQQYELDEMLKIGLPKLLRQIPTEVTEILERNLLLALDIEATDATGRRREDFSYIWRPAIEDHEQNHDFGKIKEVLVSLLRDALMNLGSLNLERALRPILKRYAKSRYTIFKRLALFVMSERADRFADLIKPFVFNKKNLDDHRIRHELFGLLKKNFPVLDSDTQQYILAWIETGPETKWWIRWRTKEEGKAPSGDTIQRFANHWKLERYWIIREHVPEKEEVIKQLEKELGPPEHPDFPTWHESSFGGPESPLSGSQLKEMTDEELLSVLKNPPPPRKDDPVYGQESLAMVFEGTVKEDLQRFLPFASKMATVGVRPIFVQYYFRALRESWAPHKLQWTDDLDVLARITALENPISHGWSPEGRSRMRLDLSRLIEGIVSNRSIELSDEQLVKFRSLLISMIGDPDPPATEELQNYSMNQDWPFIALNHTSGEVLHVLIKYALCYARKHPEPSARLEAEVRESLQGILTSESRPSVFSVFGTYLANLWYLDAAWVKQNLHMMFPKKDQLKADAVWDAYLKFNNVYKDVFASIRPQYAQAVHLLRSKVSKTSRDDQRLAQHLALIYWHGWDDIGGKGSLVSQFFSYAPVDVRSGFIRQIGMGLREMKEQAQLAVDRDVWKRPRKLWEWRLRVPRSVNKTSYFDAEMGEFLDWLPNIPEDVTTMQKLLSKTLRKRATHSPTGPVTEYLNTQSKDHPLECVRLLYDLFSLPWDRGYYYFDHKEVGKILEIALNAGGEAKRLAAKVASKLGEYGLFEFKPIWEKAQEGTEGR